jgi:hypothetical protein
MAKASRLLLPFRKSVCRLSKTLLNAFQFGFCHEVVLWSFLNLLWSFLICQIALSFDEPT